MIVKLCEVIGITKRENYNLVHFTYPTDEGLACVTVFLKKDVSVPVLKSKHYVSVRDKYPSIVDIQD